MSARRTTSSKPRRQPRRAAVGLVHQFLVVLAHTDPLIWRRIQVPGDYSFWDLHVAIQDAMGWLDYHLHEFTVTHPKTGRVLRIGIPDQEGAEEPAVPGWEVSVAGHFIDGGPLALYVYDFGDDWQHVLMYEGASPPEAVATYPRCVGGARTCPPEDCGGPHRYAEVLAALADPRHPERADLLAGISRDFDPAAFDAATVRFDDPEERWKRAFEE